MMINFIIIILTEKIETNPLRTSVIGRYRAIISLLLSITILEFSVLVAAGGPFDNFLMKYETTNSPDTYLSAPKIIRRHGYPSEAHEVVSEDGYILELHRIPHGKIRSTSVKKETPVLLQHGILCTSVDWILNGPDKSLGYVLADKGYDVWLGNMRGNTYSKGHVHKNPINNDYWDFTFHESGYYDLPATIDYILQRTNSTQLIYIGYSMGTTIFYVMCATRPEYNKKIKLHIGLAPVSSITYNRSIIRHVIPNATLAQVVMDRINAGAVLERDIFIRIGTKVMCGRDVFNTNLCLLLMIDLMFGSNLKGMNKSIIPIMVSHTPAGTSIKTLIHFAQMFNADKFQQYNYGFEGNKVMYNQSTPPQYDLTKVTVPAALFYGENDLLSDTKDVRLLYHKLPRPVELTRIKDDQFTHLDFIINKDVNELLNDQLIRLMEKSETPGYLEERIAIALNERWEAVKQYPWYWNVMNERTTAKVDVNNNEDIDINNNNNNSNVNNNNNKDNVEEDTVVKSSTTNDEDKTDNVRILLQKRNSNRSIQIIHGEYRKNMQRVASR